MSLKVAVIGAGALGLAATKIFIEDGWDVTTFESRDYIGGLWKDSDDSSISVHATTIFNSSKFRAAISDFPFADSDDDYPTAAQLHAYLERYADHFNLRPNIQLQTKVLNIRRDGQRWEVTTQKKGFEAVHRYFDKVCISTGSFSTPRWPKLEGLEKFQGNVRHSIDFHHSQEYKDQNVLLLGMHATAQDVANALSENAKHVYLAHRSGVVMLPRYTEDGSTFDSNVSLTASFFMAWASKTIPSLWNWVVDKLVTKSSLGAFPDMPKSWGIRPAESLAVSAPLMGDTIWPHLQSGLAEPVCAVSRITGPRSLELTNGRILEDIDSIIYCTGYHFNIPEGLVTDDIHPYPGGSKSLGKEPKLYHNIFSLHPDESIRNSIAYIGQAGIILPGFIQHELIVMAISQTWLGNSPLPPLETMRAWYEKNVAERQALARKHKPKEASTFYPVLLNFGDHFPWIDAAAGTGLYQNLGMPLFNWRAWKLWWQDKELYRLCTKGLFTPVIFRLFKTGKRKALDAEKCRAMIVRENERLAETRRRKVDEKKKK